MIVAKIIPIKSLPFGLNLFDYTVPKRIREKIQPGQIVIIPFRKSEILGLVLKVVEEKSNQDLKMIKSLVNDQVFLCKKQTQFVQQMSNIYHISLPKMIKICLPPLKKNKLKKAKLKTIYSKAKLAKIFSPFYYYYDNADEHKKFIHKILSRHALILVPEIHHCQDMVEKIPQSFRKKLAVWHSELSDKQKFEIWMQIRNGQKNVVIGTRGAIFMPFQHLKTIIIDREHDENHKQWDQNPRFSVHDAAQILASVYKCEITKLSFSPSASSYFEVKKGLVRLGSKKFSQDIKFNNTQIIDIKKERQSGNYDIFSFFTEEKLKKNKADIFIMANRLGYARSVNCTKCGFVQTCPRCRLPLIYFEKKHLLQCSHCKTDNKYHTNCPRCGGQLAKLKGYGIEYVESILKKMFTSDKRSQIVRIDSNVKKIALNKNKRQIIVGTSMALPYIRWKKTSLIVFADFDRILQTPEYLAIERAWHLLNQIRYRKKDQARIIIQTNSPSHLLFRSLFEPERYYRTDLNYRLRLGYPPYVSLVRYFYGHPQEKKAGITAFKMYEKLRKELTEIEKSAKISYPIQMQPCYFRKKFWYNIVIKLPLKNWQKNLMKINELIGPDWKTDPNPINLLSP